MGQNSACVGWGALQFQASTGGLVCVLFGWGGDCVRRAHSTKPVWGGQGPPLLELLQLLSSSGTGIGDRLAKGACQIWAWQVCAPESTGESRPAPCSHSGGGGGGGAWRPLNGGGLASGLQFSLPPLLSGPGFWETSVSLSWISDRSVTGREVRGWTGRLKVSPHSGILDST